MEKVQSVVEFQVGDRFKFKNLPETFPHGVVTAITPHGFRYRLDRPITHMGYEKPKMNDGYEDEIKVINEGECTQPDQCEKE